MNNFERRFGKFSINNLTMYIVIGRIMVFLLALFNVPFYEYLTYDADAIMSGQVWRLFTFMFIPRSDMIWFIFEIMFLYWVGTGLEQVWGSFRYTMYFLGSISGVAVATLIIYFTGMKDLDFAMFMFLPSLFSYSIFLPFAWYYGEEEIRVMLFLPIKIKYLAIIDILLIVSLFAQTPPSMWIVFVLSMINMLVFFTVVLLNRGKHKKRLAGFRHEVYKAERASKKKAIHRCSICGITENDDSGMSFRYCSKCEGDYEFCEKHLSEHEHFKKVVEFEKHD